MRSISAGGPEAFGCTCRYRDLGPGCGYGRVARLRTANSDIPARVVAADADMLAIALECRGAVEVDVRFDCPESEGLVVRGIPDGRVKVTLVRRDHRMSVVARECVLVEFKAMRWGGGCA